MFPRILAVALALSLVADAAPDSERTTNILKNGGLSKNNDLDDVALGYTLSAKGAGIPFTGLRSRPPSLPMFRSQAPRSMAISRGHPETNYSAIAAPVSSSPGGLVIRSDSQYPIPATGKRAAAMDALTKLKGTVIKQYLPLALAVAIATGINYPQLGQSLNAIRIDGLPGPAVKYFCGCWIFFVSGAALKLDEIRKAVASIKPILIGLGLVNFLTPLISIPLQAITWVQKEIITGFIIFANMPTVTSMGSQLSLAAGGNFAFAIILATLTNFVCIVQIPQTLAAFLGGGAGAGVSIDPVAMQKTLVSNILIPLFLGKAFFTLPPLAKIYKDFGLFFKLSTFTALAFLPMLEISQNVKAITSMGIDTLFKTGLVAIGFHSTLLAFNFLVTGLMGVSLELRKTLIILGSQKQLTVSMAVLAILPDTMGNKGLMAFPCIIGWLTQNFMDTMAANKMSTWTVEDENMTAAEAEAAAGRKKSAAAAAAIAEKREETKKVIAAKNRVASTKAEFEKSKTQFFEAYSTGKDKRKAIAAISSSAAAAVRAELSLAKARFATDEASARVTGEMARAQDEATNTSKGGESLSEQDKSPESLSEQAQVGPFPELLGTLPSLLTGLLVGSGLTLTGLHVLQRRNKLAWLPSTLTAGHEALLTA